MMYTYVAILILTLSAYGIHRCARATVALELNTFACLRFVASAKTILLGLYDSETPEHD